MSARTADPRSPRVSLTLSLSLSVYSVLSRFHLYYPLH